MPLRFRFSLSTVLLTLTSCALAIGWLSTVDRQQPELPNVPTEAVIRSSPITLSMNYSGGLAIGGWSLSLNSAGDAQLTVERYPAAVTHEFQVSKSQVDELRDLLVRERFFALDDDYGELVPDGSTETLTISVGGYVNTVRLHFLMNWAHSDQAKLREPARAVRVSMLIRGWFQHPDVADTRKYDQMVLNAVATHEKSPSE